MNQRYIPGGKGREWMLRNTSIAFSGYGTVHVFSTRATAHEAHKRIDEVLNPYLENLHQKHEAGLIGVLSDLKVALYGAFDDFGFEVLDINSVKGEDR